MIVRGATTRYSELRADVLWNYADRHRLREIDRFLLPPRVQDPHEPVLAFPFSTVLEHPFPESRDVVGCHAKTTVRVRRPETAEVARSMYVVVGLLEENLHDFHWIPFLTRSLG